MFGSAWTFSGMIIRKFSAALARELRDPLGLLFLIGRAQLAA